MPIAPRAAGRVPARPSAARRLLRALLLAALASPLALPAPAAAQGEVLQPPRTADGKPLDVVVGVHLEQLDDVDEAQQRASIAGWLELRWQDRRAAFDGAAAGVAAREWAGPAAQERLGREVWWPDPLLMEAEEGGELDRHYLRVDTAGNVWLAAHFKAEVQAPVDLRRFPYDRQAVRVAFESYSATAGEVRFRPVREISGVGRRISLAEWRVEGFQVRHEVEDYRQMGEMWDAYSRYVFEVSIARRYGFYHWKVLLPLAMIVASGWMVFWFRDLSTQLSVGFTVLLTVVAFHFAVSDDLPRVAYLTFMDALLLAAHLSVFLSLLTVVLAHVLEQRGQGQRADRIERTARWAFPVSLGVALSVIAAVML
jgi:hypothetical protein